MISNVESCAVPRTYGETTGRTNFDSFDYGCRRPAEHFNGNRLSVMLFTSLYQPAL